MKPVMQTEKGPRGNCYSACLASLFELTLDEVPNFFDGVDGYDTTSQWWGSVRKWLAEKGFGIISISLSLPNGYEWLENYEGYFIVCGMSNRGLYHATLWNYGKMCYDPHPDQTGLLEPDSVDLLYPLDPAKLFKLEKP
jgi:hypothetical protein